MTGFYLIVMAVAGASAVALLGWPAHSGTYFSWDLGQPSAAATVGGLYLASVAAFGAALVEPRSHGRSLRVGVLALSVPTLWFTLVHRSVFDWSRPQAIAWVILFSSAPVSIGWDHVTSAPATEPADSPPATPLSRLVLATVAAIGTAGAAAIWVEPLRSMVAPQSPLPIAGLTGRYLGAWCAFLAATAASATLRGRAHDARLVAVLLGSVSIGLLTAGARTIDEFGPNASAYAAAIVALGVIALLLHRTNRVANPPAGKLAGRGDPGAADLAATLGARAHGSPSPAMSTIQTDDR